MVKIRVNVVRNGDVVCERLYAAAIVLAWQLVEEFMCHWRLIWSGS